MPNGASVHAVTVLAVGAGQVVAVPGAGRVPSTMSVTVTSCAISGVRPTAPFQVNAVPVPTPTPGEEPLVAPSVVAGSPRTSGVGQSTPVVVIPGQPGKGVLNRFGHWVLGLPAATCARPESGPKENMNVCVPSASVMKPSPPEICWHLMAPFTVPGFGVTYCCALSVN